MLRTGAIPVLFLFFSIASVKAATFTVNTLLDNEANGCAIGACTLREAINDANALSGADTINFNGGLSGTMTLTQGQLLITQSVTINGSGARTLGVSGAGNSRVFQIEPILDLLNPSATINISGLTITGGNGAVNTVSGLPITPGPGGSILNTGGATLNLIEVNISGNNIPFIAGIPSNLLVGGGIATIGTDLNPTTTNITRSLISGNSAVGGGGGISNTGTELNIIGATTTITNSTVTNNFTDAAGGGILNTAGTVNSTNNTVSHNRSVVLAGGAVNVLGISPVGTINLRNTIVAANTDLLGTNLLFPDTAGLFNSLGNNLIGNSGDVGITIGLDANVTAGGMPSHGIGVDVVGSIQIGFITVDALLGALQNNGGRTDTRALLVSSPALERANNCVNHGTCSTFNPIEPVLLTDQRGSGFFRRVDNDADGTATVNIGAFEAQLPPTAAAVTIAGRVTDANGRAISATTVKLTGPNGSVRTCISNQFGYYQFESVTAGETYLLEAVHKIYIFAPRTVNVLEDLSDLDLRAEGKILR